MKNQEEMSLFLQDQLIWAQQDQAYLANLHCQPHLKLNIGNMVYMNAKHFASERENKSLSSKNASH